MSINTQPRPYVLQTAEHLVKLLRMDSFFEVVMETTYTIVGDDSVNRSLQTLQVKYYIVIKERTAVITTHTDRVMIYE